MLDLIECARTLDEAYDWICRAIGRRLTTADTPPHCASALVAGSGGGSTIELALGYAKGGALSVLEFRYRRGVEHPHGLPTAQRQVRVRQATGNRYLDNLYQEHRACVEIDGAAAHPEDEQWRDKNRDRWNSVHEKIETIRVGVSDLLDSAGPMRDGRRRRHVANRPRPPSATRAPALTAPSRVSGPRIGVATVK